MKNLFVIHKITMQLIKIKTEIQGIIRLATHDVIDRQWLDTKLTFSHCDLYLPVLIASLLHIVLGMINAQFFVFRNQSKAILQSKKI